MSHAFPAFNNRSNGEPAVHDHPACAPRDDRNGWDIETGAFSWYDESGVSVVAPLGGDGTHSWGYWGGQLQAMKPDIQRVLGAAPCD